MKITYLLNYKSGCFWPLSGLMVIYVEGDPEISINYGTGECDDIATLIIGGVSTEIQLGK